MKSCIIMKFDKISMNNYSKIAKRKQYMRCFIHRWCNIYSVAFVFCTYRTLEMRSKLVHQTHRIVPKRNRCNKLWIIRYHISQSQSSVRRIINYDWLIFYGLRLITPRVRLLFMLTRCKLDSILFSQVASKDRMRVSVKSKRIMELFETYAHKRDCVHTHDSTLRSAADKISVTIILRRELKPISQSGYCFRFTYSNGNRNNNTYP